MKRQVQDILDAFLPAMAQIQASEASDDKKKAMAKEWLRKRLQVFLTSDEKVIGRTDN
jgi:hypothetical protein